MGMFDYVHCEMELPIDKEGRRHTFDREHSFQTKSFPYHEQDLRRFLITKEGSLVECPRVHDEGAKHNRVDWDDQTPELFTGYLHFYGELVDGKGFDIEKRGWAEWEVEFSRGQALSVRRVRLEEWKTPEEWPHKESWYTWRIMAKVEDEGSKRLLVPWSDPTEYEFPFDFIYETPEAAEDGLILMNAEDDAKEQGWILCKMTLETTGQKAD